MGNNSATHKNFIHNGFWNHVNLSLVNYKIPALSFAKISRGLKDFLSVTSSYYNLPSRTRVFALGLPLQMAFEASFPVCYNFDLLYDFEKEFSKLNRNNKSEG